MLWGLTDSKQLSAADRRHWSARVHATAVAARVAHVSPRLIDRIGIAAASRLAMLRALDALPVAPDHVIVDAFPLAADCRYANAQDAIVRADATCLAVAAASVCAKVARDELMQRLGLQYIRPTASVATRATAHRRIARRWPPRDRRRCTARVSARWPSAGASHRPRSRRRAPVNAWTARLLARLRRDFLARRAPVEDRAALGRWGEDLAARELRRRGYDVLERNQRVGRGEVDLVARQGETVVLVEVKTRRTGRLRRGA